jgi:DNA replication protein DnaC
MADIQTEMQRRIAELEKRYPPLSPEEQAARKAKEAEQAAEDLRRQRSSMIHHFLQSIGRRYESARFTNYQITCQAQEDAVNRLKDYRKHMPERVAGGSGIVLLGPPGTGKDHLLVALGGYAIEVHGMTIKWTNGVELYGRFRDRMDRKGDESELDLINELARPDILYISDPLPPNGPLSEFQQTSLYRIIDSRYRHQRPTWCSINVANHDEAVQRMGAATVDRLRDDALTILCNWKSHRQPFVAGKGEPDAGSAKPAA